MTPRRGRAAGAPGRARAAAAWGRAAVFTVIAAALLLAGAAGAIPRRRRSRVPARARWPPASCAQRLAAPPIDAAAPGPPGGGLLDLGHRRPCASRRSVLAGALIAFATFVVVAVGAFRRVETGSPDDAASGTGGYMLMADRWCP